MKRPLLLLALASWALHAQAAPNDGIAGPYARVEVGPSHFTLSGSSTRPGSNGHNQAVKLFGGYRLDDGLGIEAGYTALGSFTETVVVDGVGEPQKLKGRSLFATATGRWPLGESWALHGRLGLSSGRVSGPDRLAPADQRIGARVSPVLGIGAEFRPRPTLALTLNLDDYGRLSDTVRARALLFGLHFTP